MCSQPQCLNKTNICLFFRWICAFKHNILSQSESKGLNPAPERHFFQSTVMVLKSEGGHYGCLVVIGKLLPSLVDMGILKIDSVKTKQKLTAVSSFQSLVMFEHAQPGGHPLCF